MQILSAALATAIPHQAVAALSGTCPYAPFRTLPAEVTDIEAFRVRRRDRVGGVIHEYEHAA